jgi:hypothetical protein
MADSTETDGEQLVAWSAAARRLGRTSDTLTEWYLDGHGPAVRSPTNQLLTYQSWVDDVLASPRPGVAGDMIEVARAWWRARFPEALREVA